MCQFRNKTLSACRDKEDALQDEQSTGVAKFGDITEDNTGVAKCGDVAEDNPEVAKCGDVAEDNPGERARTQTE